MTKDELIARLQADVERHGSQAAWAKKHGVTRAFVSAILKGKREPGAKVLAAIGIRRVTMTAYEEIESNATRD